MSMKTDWVRVYALLEKRSGFTRASDTVVSAIARHVYRAMHMYGDSRNPY